MTELWQILSEFIFRLTFGMATAMAITSGQQVSSGFFRVHLWVLMGLNTLAALAVFSSGEHYAAPAWLLGCTIAAAVVSYLGAVIWLYEQNALGKAAIILVAILGLACGGLSRTAAAGGFALAMDGGDFLTSGLLLGGVLTAMLLGHWYLNVPGMKLAPLQRLLLLLAVAVLLRAMFCLTGYCLIPTTQTTAWRLFLTLRWLSGLIGVGVMTAMTWQTLKIPNTQSATGILYAGVILAFIGELTSQLLTSESAFPV
ncbi:hypothetical protein [Lignipirellula cremea]|uniref:Uncharacterized protein n=1 Tax=Lignipirellula cremea TaxID=2528010 RepID=A0A518DNZ7_9BACT|nr:hypothetical protein [Lignipirellula cremea]QDU93560.1 hypothetical protein Pla8534_13400 [Lignipirellula cremea]